MQIIYVGKKWYLLFNWWIDEYFCDVKFSKSPFYLLIVQLYNLICSTKFFWKIQIM